MHDTRLGDALAERADLSSLCPAMVRRAGWVVAAEGHAGRAAAAAAQFMLGEGAARLASASARLESALALYAAGAPADPVARERLAGVLADVHSSDGAPARLPALIDTVAALAAALADWAAAQSGPAAAAAQAVAAAARLAHRGALHLLRAAVGRLDDPATLLRDWLVDPAAVEQALSRAEWMLDGWQRLVLLWQAALPGPASAALEMAALVPAWPDEADAWLDLPAGTAARVTRRPGPAARPLPSFHWSDPAIVVDRIARNEICAHWGCDRWRSALTACPGRRCGTCSAPCWARATSS